MPRFGRYLSMRLNIAFAAAALFAGPAHAFFPPIPIYIPVPPAKKKPILVPALPPVTEPVVTPPHGGSPSPPQSAPEPNGLVLALLGSGGVSLFAACRRRRPRE